MSWRGRVGADVRSGHENELVVAEKATMTTALAGAGPERDQMIQKYLSYLMVELARLGNRLCRRFFEIERLGSRANSIGMGEYWTN